MSWPYYYYYYYYRATGYLYALLFLKSHIPTAVPEEVRGGGGKVLTLWGPQVAGAGGGGGGGHQLSLVNFVAQNRPHRILRQ